jgi:uncharacterized delta-60 repeat protein
LVAVLITSSAQATPGALDSSFGAGGKVTTAIGPTYDQASALALQPDGKLIAAGISYNGSDRDFALVRYNPNGSLDTSFNGTGKVTTAIGPGDDWAEAVALQPDGKLVVAGYSWNGSDYDLALVRYNPNGSLDTSFNGTGKVTTAIGPASDGADALALQPDGKLVAAGFSWNGSDWDFALVRYHPDGSLDTSLNGTGKVTTPIGLSSVADALTLQSDGKLVLAGYSSIGPNVFALARYNPDGSLDTSFNGTGKVTTAIGGDDDVANALALQPDGKLVAAGYTKGGTQYSFALARYNPDGSLDTSFNGTGKVTTRIGLSNQAYALALQPDGKLVAAGSSYNSSNDDFALARYKPDGSPDTNFNGTGKVTTPIGPGGDDAKALVLQPDGKLVAAGYSWNGSNYDFALARYLGKDVCVVPRVKGKILVAARRAIVKAHCSVGKVTRAFSSKVKKGRVISQKPQAGKRLGAGSKVKLMVSKGKKA